MAQIPITSSRPLEPNYSPRPPELPPENSEAKPLVFPDHFAWKAADTSLRTAARITSLFTRTLSIAAPQYANYLGLVSNIMQPGDMQEKLTDAALFALSLVPFYGNFVDVYQAYAIVQKEGWNASAMMYAGSAAIGFLSGPFRFGRIVRVGEQACARSHLKTSFQGFVIQAKRAQKEGVTFTDPEVKRYMRHILHDLGPTVTKRINDKAYISNIKKKTMEAIQGKCAPLAKLEYEHNAEILRQISRGSDPWIRIGSYAYAPRPVYGVVHPLNYRLLGERWGDYFNTAHMRTPFKQGLAKANQHALIRRDFSVSSWAIRHQVKKAKTIMDKVVSDVTEQFGNSFTVDPLGQSVKAIASAKDKVTKGRVPFDVYRNRFIVKDNETAHAMTRYFLRRFPCAIPNFTLSRTAHLTPGKAYRAAHVVIPFRGGTIEIQMMGPNMRHWFDRDHDFYKLGQKPHLTHYQEGLDAFKADGPLNYSRKALRKEV